MRSTSDMPCLDPPTTYQSGQVQWWLWWPGSKWLIITTLKRVIFYATFTTTKNPTKFADLSNELKSTIPEIRSGSRVACQLALITGVALWVMAMLRMSFLVRFISRPALSGFVTGKICIFLIGPILYLSGSAFVILATQMKDFFGLRSVPKGVDFFENIYFIGTSLPQVRCEIPPSSTWDDSAFSSNSSISLFIMWY